MKSFILAGGLLLSCSLVAQSPGGVSYKSFWIKESSVKEMKMVIGLNFNAVMATDANSTIKLPGHIQSLKRVTIFTVYQPAKQDAPIWEINGRHGDLTLSTRELLSKGSKVNLVFENNKHAASGGIIHTYRGRTAAAENDEGKNPYIRFGSVQQNTSAAISEFILYERILSDQDITKIETYLALKYGITLQKNYVNTNGDVIWNFKKDSIWSNNIAGIARDDQSTLYQKQATSSNAPGQLVIGIDKIFTSNHENTGIITNKNFLIWGDNAESLTLNENSPLSATGTMLSQRKWLMKRSGNNADKLSTQLTIDAKELLAGKDAKDIFYLVIDRSGTGEFAEENCIWLIPDNISPEGLASFKGVHWDTDGSGRDMFAFGIRSAQVKTPNKGAAALLSFQLYPNPVTDGNYKIAVTLDKPTDIEIRVYDIHQRLVHSSKASGQASYVIPGNIKGAAGSYTVRLITAEKEYSRIIVVQ
jgi:hypothetical protein